MADRTINSNTRRVRAENNTYFKHENLGCLPSIFWTFLLPKIRSSIGHTLTEEELTLEMYDAQLLELNDHIQEISTELVIWWLKKKLELRLMHERERLRDLKWEIILMRDDPKLYNSVIKIEKDSRWT